MTRTIMHEKIVFVCDNCGDSFETGISVNDPDAFHAAAAMMNDVGWRRRQHLDEWELFCKECEDFREAI